MADAVLSLVYTGVHVFLEVGSRERMHHIDEAVRRAEGALGPDATPEQIERVAGLLLERSPAMHAISGLSLTTPEHEAVVIVDATARPGLLASIANVLENVKCAVLDVSQKTSAGRSALLLRVSLVRIEVPFAELQTRLSAVGAAFDARVAIHRADIHAAMNGD